MKCESIYGLKSNILKLNLMSSIYIISWILIPVIRNTLSSGIFQFIFMLVAIVWLFTAIMTNKTWFNKMFPILCIGMVYLIFILIYYCFGPNDMKLNDFVEPMFIFFMILFGSFYIFLNNKNADKIILAVATFCFIFTAITTIYNLSIDMNTARLLTSSSTSTYIRNELEKKNIGSFDFVYGQLILFPLVTILIKKGFKGKKRNKVKLLFFLIAILNVSVIIMANFLTAYLFLIIALSLFFIDIGKNLKIRIIFYSIICMLSLPLLIELIKNILVFMVDLTPSINTQIKINRMINFFSGDQDFSDISIRVSLTKNSIFNFFKSPLFGVGAYYRSNTIIGSHSQFIDDFARYGIIGATPLLISFSMYKNKLAHIFNKKAQKNMLNICWYFFYALCLFNQMYSYSILLAVFVISPITIRYFENFF